MTLTIPDSRRLLFITHYDCLSTSCSHINCINISWWSFLCLVSLVVYCYQLYVEIDKLYLNLKHLLNFSFIWPTSGWSNQCLLRHIIPGDACFGDSICKVLIILYFQDKHYSKVKIYYKDYTIQRYAKDKGIYERTRENKDYSIIQLYNSY